MKFLSFFSLSYLITIIFDYIKKRARDKKIKTPPKPIENININVIKKETKDPIVSYDFLGSNDIREDNKYQDLKGKGDKKESKKHKFDSNTIYLKLNDYYEHQDFIFIGDSKLDGDPVYGYIGNPRMLNTHNIIYVELI